MLAIKQTSHVHRRYKGSDQDPVGKQWNLRLQEDQMLLEEMIEEHDWHS